MSRTVTIPTPVTEQRQIFNEPLELFGRRIVGVRNAKLIHKTTDDDTGDLTQTTAFGEGEWDEIKADAARIELVNSTGNTRVLTDCVVRAKPVVRLSGDVGYVHDANEDFEDIVKNGERVFRFGNGEIVTKDQLEQLADYYWKYNKTRKHVFVISLPGTCYWYQPGGWYRLDIGAAGESENIDSLCECMYVRTSRRTGENGTTMIGFREVEEAFKHDSNAVARFLAGGNIEMLVESNDSIVVGSQYFTGKANSYCDGVADEVEINNAITLANEKGGGIVYLQEGTYITAAAIEMKSNVVLMGSGKGTIIEKNCDDHAIEAVGGAGTELSNITIRDLKVTRNAADTNASKYLLRLDYSDDANILNVIADDSYSSILVTNTCDRLLVDGLTSTGFLTNAGINITGGESITLNNILLDGDGNNVANGISTLSATQIKLHNIEVRNISADASAAVYGILVSTDEGDFSNIKVRDFTRSDAVFFAIGFQAAGDYNRISNLEVSNIDNSDTAANSYGVEIVGSGTVISSLIATGCSGTGVIINVAAVRTQIAAGRSTNNGTNYTDSSATTTIAAFDVT